jgi:hypothetical protein
MVLVEGMLLAPGSRACHDGLLSHYRELTQTGYEVERAKLRILSALLGGWWNADLAAAGTVATYYYLVESSRRAQIP